MGIWNRRRRNRATLAGVTDQEVAERARHCSRSGYSGPPEQEPSVAHDLYRVVGELECRFRADEGLRSAVDAEASARAAVVTTRRPTGDAATDDSLAARDRHRRRAHEAAQRHLEAEDRRVLDALAEHATGELVPINAYLAAVDRFCFDDGRSVVGQLPIDMVHRVVSEAVRPWRIDPGEPRR